MCAVKKRQVPIWLGEILPFKSHHLQGSVQQTQVLIKLRGLKGKFGLSGFNRKDVNKIAAENVE